jgi:hypothetical protein
MSWGILLREEKERACLTVGRDEATKKDFGSQLLEHVLASLQPVPANPVSHTPATKHC